MLNENGNNHGWIFRSLRLMDRYGIGVDQFIQVAIVITNLPIIDDHSDSLGLLIDQADPPDVPIKDLFVIVIDNLHDPVVDFKGSPAPEEPLLSGVEGLLKFNIEITGPVARTDGDGDVRHRGIGYGINHLRAVLDDPALFVDLSHHVSRDVL